MSASVDAARDRRIGRIVGVLLLLQLAVAPLVNFGLLKPVFAAPGFLVNAAANAPQMSLAALLNVSLGALSLGMAITAWPVFRRYSEVLALWFVSLAVASFALTAVESETLLSMLSVSQEHVKAGASDRELFEVLRVATASARNWAHYVGLMVASGMLIAFYSALYRSALIPRALAALGLFGATVQLAAVAMPLFAQRIVFLMLTPLALSHLALMAWLLAKGFEERRP